MLHDAQKDSTADKQSDCFQSKAAGLQATKLLVESFKRCDSSDAVY